jgi:uncharacterized protein (DUF433 family)
MFTGLATCKTILDDWTQGESFEDLQAHFRDLYCDLTIHRGG